MKKVDAKLGHHSQGERPKERISPLSAEREALLAEWHRTRRRGGYSERTLRQWRSDLKALFAFLDAGGLEEGQLGYREAEEYRRWLTSEPPGDGRRYARSTVAGHLRAASNFADYLKACGILLANPFSELDAIGGERRLPRTLLGEVTTAALLGKLARFDEAANTGELKRRYRMHVLAELLYSSGMRIGEAAALTMSDIDWDRSVLQIARAKGGAAHRGYLNEYARGVLRCYVEQMRSLTLDGHGDERLLFGAHSRALQRQLASELQRICSELHLGRVRAHDFRHAFAYHLLRAGCPLRCLQIFLGHRLLRSTEIYARVEHEDLRGVLDRYHPRRLIHGER